MISVIILAAGNSKRMGRPKMLLPWGNTTVIEQVVSVFTSAEVDDIILVTGGHKAEIENRIASYPVRIVYNDEYASGEMLSSLQCGLRIVKSEAEAMLVALGDQPQVQERSVRVVCEGFRKTKSNIVVPSYQMRRGHPWLVARPLWDDLLKMKSPQSPREFLNVHQDEIHYVDTNDPNILTDLDTPEDYQKWRPKNS